MDFPSMRRRELACTEKETEAMLHAAGTGVMAVVGAGGYPYAVPVNFVYFHGKIYFHSADKGHKLSAIAANPKVCFTVVAEDTVLEEVYSTRYRSVVAFGEAAIVTDEAERRAAFLALTTKYAPSRPADEIERKVSDCKAAALVGIRIDSITGKHGKYAGTDA